MKVVMDSKLRMRTAGGPKGDFLEAAEDLRYLLGKGYPRPGALTFVGNRYQLPKPDREILGRGVYPGAEALARRNKLIGPEGVKGRAVGVDGHNVLITMESAILGRDLILCDDGLIRDAAWVSNSYRPSDATDEALDLILDYLDEKGALSIVFFLYGPLRLSGELAAQIRAVLSGKGLMGRAEAVPAPTAELKDFPGLTATSNSVLIDRAAEPIDLAGQIIRRRMPDKTFITLGLL
jgi:hypothetical protein